MRLFIAISLTAASLMFSDVAAAVSPGQQCSRRDTDPLKCMACAIKGEDNKSESGMLAVGGVIITRKNSGRYPRSICGVVHQYYNGQYQFVGAGGRLPTGAQFSRVLAAAQKAMASKGNGFFGFRSYCRRGERRIGKGGNCYRRSTEVMPGGLATDTPRVVALDEINSILGGASQANGPRVQMAELPGRSVTIH